MSETIVEEIQKELELRRTFNVLRAKQEETWERKIQREN